MGGFVDLAALRALDGDPAAQREAAKSLHALAASLDAVAKGGGSLQLPPEPEGPHRDTFGRRNQPADHGARDALGRRTDKSTSAGRDGYGRRKGRP